MLHQGDIEPQDAVCNGGSHGRISAPHLTKQGVCGATQARGQVRTKVVRDNMIPDTTTNLGIEAVNAACFTVPHEPNKSPRYSYIRSVCVEQHSRHNTICVDVSGGPQYLGAPWMIVVLALAMLTVVEQECLRWHVVQRPNVFRQRATIVY